MPNKGIALAISAIIVGAFVFCNATGCSSPTGSGTPTANTVTMSSLQFSPATLTVAKGTTVTWTNNDGATVHTATSDGGTWDTGDIAGGSSKSITFSTAGTYPYHCIYHVSMGMTGTIIVQ